jgi:uncharacterized protein YigE (DUF2233 family)
MKIQNSKFKIQKASKNKPQRRPWRLVIIAFLSNFEFRILNFCVAALVLFLMAGPFSANAADWQQPVPGIFYTKVRVERAEQDAHLDVFRVDPGRHVIKPLISLTRKTAQQFALENKALLTINANFFDEKFQPLGLILSEGKILNPLKNISWWSIFCLKNGKASIVHSSQAQGLSCDTAIQAGPRLVVDGNIPKLKEDISYRTAIGINQKQEVLFIVTRDLMSMTELAQVLSKPEAAGGLGCQSALNLDGGSSSQIFAQVGDLQVGFGGFVGVPVGLGVFSR